MDKLAAKFAKLNPCTKIRGKIIKNLFKKSLSTFQAVDRQNTTSQSLWYIYQ